jgi:hypothetical protein
VADLLGEHARLADPTDVRGDLEMLLQDEIGAREMRAVVDVVVRAVVVEGEGAAEAEAIEQSARPAFDTSGVVGDRSRIVGMRDRGGGRAGADEAAEQRDQDRDRADQLSFSR